MLASSYVKGCHDSKMGGCGRALWKKLRQHREQFWSIVFSNFNALILIYFKEQQHTLQKHPPKVKTIEKNHKTLFLMIIIINLIYPQYNNKHAQDSQNINTDSARSNYAKQFKTSSTLLCF